MERRAPRASGFLMLGLLLVLLVIGGVLVQRAAAGGTPTGRPIVAIVLTLGSLIFVAIASGLFVISPNEVRIIQFFGRYVGSIRVAGLGWTFPFTSKQRMSLRVRNFETARLKVADADGNPVEIAAVVVWRVVDSFKAAFGVDNHVGYVAVQAEAAVRQLATSYPYEAHGSGRPSLRDGDVVSEALTAELSERVARAGVEVLESRITHLAYAPEIAQAMLARQQASAIVAARYTIVEGAVGMVQNALERLHAQDVVELDEERKAQMVANLLVVLCGDRAVQPVVNTGTLYG
jgi:SPFH domain / Band 7 family